MPAFGGSPLFSVPLINECNCDRSLHTALETGQISEINVSRQTVPSPSNRGYSIPEVAPAISAAAPLARAYAISASPASHELATKPREVFNQSDLPCCVSCALTSATESLSGSSPPLAPLFHYYVTRYDLGGADSTGNLDLDVGLLAVSSKGVARAALHTVPFTPAGAATKPTNIAYADAATRALNGGPFRRRYVPASGASRAKWIREQIAQERPVVIAFRLPTNYPETFLNSKLEWLDPDTNPASVSGHCVVATGYNDLRQAVHIQDSRGSQTFAQGSWWMGYRIIDSPVVQAIYALVP